MIKSDSAMADMNRAKRIKEAILECSTYEEMSYKTGISVSTLVRISSGKTEPKLKDIADIAKLSRKTLDWLVFGSTENIKTCEERAYAADSCDDEVTEAHHFIIWNLRTLDKEDILAIARQVHALSTYSYARKIANKRMLEGMAEYKRKRLEASKSSTGQPKEAPTPSKE